MLCACIGISTQEEEQGFGRIGRGQCVDAPPVVASTGGRSESHVEEAQH